MYFSINGTRSDKRLCSEKRVTKMRLFFYMFRRYCGYALAVVVLCLFLFIFFDFSHRARVFFSKVETSALDIAWFYFYQLPFLVVQALPIAALLAAVVTMLVLGRNNEITAMRAAGAGPRRLFAPLLVGGLLCSALGCMAGEWLVPLSAERMRRLEAQMAGDTAYRRDKHVWLKNGNMIFRYQAYDSYRQRLLGLKQIELHEEFGVRSITTAAQADYRGKDWLLHEVRVLHYDQHGWLRLAEAKQSSAVRLPFELTWLQREQRPPLEMSRAQLMQLIRARHARGENTLAQQVDLHLKIAYPCAALFVVLLGIRFGFLYQRRAVRGVMATFAIGFAYWLLLGICMTLGRVGALAPFTAAWLANAVLLLYCLGQVRVVCRQ